MRSADQPAFVAKKASWQERTATLYSGVGNTVAQWEVLVDVSFEGSG